MRKMLISSFLVTTLAIPSWSNEPPSDWDDDDKEFYRQILEQISDDDDSYSESGDVMSMETTRTYLTRSKKRKAETPPEDIAPPVIKKIKIDLDRIPYPQDIYNELTQYTIGQNDAMRSLSIFIHTHLINTRINESREQLETPATRPMEKSNILMIGPTGCGKTSSLEVLARFLDSPLVVGNATEWTSQGYIGRKWQDLFEELWSSAQIHLNKDGKTHSKQEIKDVAEKATIFIDEIDKLCTGSESQNLNVISRVQQELLPVIQGTKVKLKSGDELDTSNILFIAGGAFAGLTTDDKKKKQISPHDLHTYGMLPELAGRLANIVQFVPLDKSHLINIITQSKHSFMSQFIFKFKIAYGIDLTFSDEAIDHIADMASQQLTGARAINVMINKIMEDILFNIADYMNQPLTISKAMAVKSLKNFTPPKKDRDGPPLSMYS